MQAPIIKNMTKQTVEAVERVERQCFTCPWSLASLEVELANPAAVFRIAEVDGHIAGYAGMHHIIDEGYITNVAVLPDYRRKGVAKALMREMVYYARANGLRLITLEVRESNIAALALYHSLGFEEAGKRRGFYRKPLEDGLIMTKYF